MSSLSLHTIRNRCSIRDGTSVVTRCINISFISSIRIITMHNVLILVVLSLVLLNQTLFLVCRLQQPFFPKFEFDITHYPTFSRHKKLTHGSAHPITSDNPITSCLLNRQLSYILLYNVGFQLFSSYIIYQITNCHLQLISPILNVRHFVNNVMEAAPLL